MEFQDEIHPHDLFVKILFRLPAFGNVARDAVHLHVLAALVERKMGRYFRPHLRPVPVRLLDRVGIRAVFPIPAGPYSFGNELPHGKERVCRQRRRGVLGEDFSRRVPAQALHRRTDVEKTPGIQIERPYDVGDVFSKEAIPLFAFPQTKVRVSSA